MNAIISRCLDSRTAIDRCCHYSSNYIHWNHNACLYFGAGLSSIIIAGEGNVAVSGELVEALRIAFTRFIGTRSQITKAIMGDDVASGLYW